MIQSITKTGVAWFVMLLFSSMSFTSCEKFVDVGHPKTQLLDSLVFQDFGTAETALLQVYIDLRSSYLANSTGRNFQFYVDDMHCYSNDPTHGTYKFFNNLLAETDESELAVHWDVPYSAIYKANKLLAGLENAGKLATASRNQLKGEALFLRALLYWRLANTFGDVPYITATDYRVNTNAVKSPREKVFEMVQKDVELAATLLPDNYPTTGRVRVNKKCAEAFLAQIYLFRKQWKEAEEMATNLISASSTYSLETDINRTFLKDSKEAIWQFAEANPGVPTQDALAYRLNVSPEDNVAYGVLTDDLMNSFETGDKRKTNWTGTFTLGPKSWNFVYKYKETKMVSTGSPEIYIVMRLSEMYLIRAEARAERENFPGAQEDIDAIRSKAGLPNTTAADKASLREAVMQERRHELFCEYAHRFFDLKRTGTITQVLGPKKPNWTDADIDFPISEKQKLLNPNLK
ncbi:RagB/SusD family nutrient uptake outer membrane protein [Pseudobacter ginsenosidimutans]|nr:RagB/SusD family nutrient uptake outer membrane protein [Pseudobacter ginsenosidimutans]